MKCIECSWFAGTPKEPKCKAIAYTDENHPFDCTEFGKFTWNILIGGAVRATIVGTYDEAYMAAASDFCCDFEIVAE